MKNSEIIKLFKDNGFEEILNLVSFVESLNNKVFFKKDDKYYFYNAKSEQILELDRYFVTIISSNGDKFQFKTFNEDFDRYIFEFIKNSRNF